MVRTAEQFMETSLPPNQHTAKNCCLTRAKTSPETLRTPTMDCSRCRPAGGGSAADRAEQPGSTPLLTTRTSTGLLLLFGPRCLTFWTVQYLYSIFYSSFFCVHMYIYTFVNTIVMIPVVALVVGHFILMVGVQREA